MNPFVKSNSIISVLNQARLYKCLPSQIIGIDPEDDYTAYCFNEACCYISQKIDQGEEPNFNIPDFYKAKPKHYKTFGDFYSKFNK